MSYEFWTADQVAEFAGEETFRRLLDGGWLTPILQVKGYEGQPMFVRSYVELRVAEDRRVRAFQTGKRPPPRTDGLPAGRQAGGTTKDGSALSPAVRREWQAVLLKLKDHVRRQGKLQQQQANLAACRQADLQRRQGHASRQAASSHGQRRARGG
jgi:hypothetical protein